MPSTGTTPKGKFATPACPYPCREMHSESVGERALALRPNRAYEAAVLNHLAVVSLRGRFGSR